MPSYSLAQRLRGASPSIPASRWHRHLPVEPLPPLPAPDLALARAVADELERRRANTQANTPPPAPKLMSSPPRAFGLGDPWRFRLPINPRFRPYSAVNFDTLRWLARSCDIVASCVSYLKEQTIQAPRHVVPRDDKDDSKTTKQQVKLATAFMDTSGGLGGVGESRMTFEGKVLDDLIVIGVAAILHGYDSLGQRADRDSQTVLALDATTIEPMVTEYGFAPDLTAPAFRQWVLGVPTGVYARDEMEYRGLPLYQRTDSPYPRCAVEDAVLCIWQIMQSDQWNRTFFTDGNTPDVYMKTPDGMTVDDAQSWQAFMDDFMGGDARTRRKLKMVPGDMQMLANGRDMEFSKMLSMNRDRIIIALGVQPAALGHVQQTYKSAQEPAMQAGREGRVEQLLTWLNEFYTDLFVRKGWDAIRCTDEETNAEDSSARAARHQIEITSGQRTPNECRQEDGQDLSDDPGADLLYLQNTLVPMEQAAAPAVAAPAMGGNDASGVPDGGPQDGTGQAGTGTNPSGGLNGAAAGAQTAKTGSKQGGPNAGPAYREQLGRADADEPRNEKGEWTAGGGTAGSEQEARSIGVPKVNYQGLHPEIASVANEALKAFKVKHPQAFKSIREVDARPVGTLWAEVTPAWPDEKKRGIKGIRLDLNVGLLGGQPMPAIINDLQKNHDKGQAATDDVRGLIDHELGHVLMDYIRDAVGKDRRAFDDFYDSLKMLSERDAAALSSLAGQNAGEFFAESFAVMSATPETEWTNSTREFHSLLASVGAVKRTDAILPDLARWERKALHRLRDRGSAVCRFESEALPTDLVRMVEDGLPDCGTTGDVAALFEEVRRYDPEQARDSRGKWATIAGTPDHMRQLFIDAVGRAKDVYPERAREAAVTSVIVDRLTPAAHRLLEANVEGIHLHRDSDEIKAAVSETPPPGAVRGCYDRKTRNLHLDGKPNDITLAGLYAHEIAHAIDGPKQVLSHTQEWQNAWKAEIVGQISAVASHNAQEGFAEFGRIMQQHDFTDLHRRSVKARYPNAYGFWNSRGLI